MSGITPTPLENSDLNIDRGGVFFSGWPSLTLTGWEKIRNMHSPDFRSGQKGLDVTNYDAVIAFYLNKLNAEGL